MATDLLDFDAVIDRTGTNCEKYDQRQARFGCGDVIPLWVADMDFAAPLCVQQALAGRLAHPVFGYTFAGDELLKAIYAWYQKRHGWRIDPARMVLAPGVVPSLFAAVNALTEPGDRVLVPSPVYPPFFGAVNKNGRRLVQSPLRHTETRYELDFDHLEKQAAETRMLLFCNPHNPVGRVWMEAELRQLIDLALRHDLVVVSDDIHCDLVYAGHQYIPLAKLAPPELRLVTAISPSKTFNIPGLSMSSLVINHEADKKAVMHVFDRAHVSCSNPFTLAAFQAAYEKGANWLDALMDYLVGNRDWVQGVLTDIDGIDCIMPEATCLLWLDCRGLGLDDDHLRDFFISKAGLGLNPGTSFGQGGSRFMRLNIGTQRAQLERAMNQLKKAL